MKKLLLISIILVSSLGLTACGNSETDSDIDKMVSILCDSFWGEEVKIEAEKIEELNNLGNKTETKYKWKEDEFEKIRNDSFQRQCPDTYQKMKEKKNEEGINIFGEK